jgi:predicted nucleic acid-binding protein
MVLVDTSVWVRFLASRGPYAAELARLLGLDEVTGHELVYGELLIGGRGLQDRGVGWIDIHLLASAIVERLQLWTADPRFAAVADELGVLYKVAAAGSADKVL